MVRTYLAMFFLLGMLSFIAVTPAAAVPAAMRLGYDTDTFTAGVQNSHPHNLSSASGSNVHAPVGGEDQVCKFCHAPHGASPQGPLWNRQDAIGPNGDGTFPLYGGAINITGIAAAEYNAGVAADPSLYPNGSTRLCLSCHDGVTAVGEVINGGNLANLNMTASGTIDLSTSHPVSFKYNAAVAAALGGTFSLPLAADIVNVDADDRMQCTTCHDPHNDTNGGAYTLPMWRLYTGVEADDYDNTCETCHNTGAPIPGGLH